MTMCSLCRRNLLAGERYRFWQSGRDRPHDRPLCVLCEGEAAQAGWLRAARPPERERATGLSGAVRLVA